ncbi:hypothetical protein GCM10011379_21200 [Filimonas zeae]|uniref:Uncharacterized protein n=1 Tax=Filimonas zeae TaxID=1737353 RepID=A0A917IXA5_9BACT|nr:hypothetical protein GCM10011379_21200 [Filimonas zeae]
MVIGEEKYCEKCGSWANTLVTGTQKQVHSSAYKILFMSNFLRAKAEKQQSAVLRNNVQAGLYTSLSMQAGDRK